MKLRILALASVVLLAWLVALPAQGQVRLDDLGFQNKPLEPGDGSFIVDSGDLPVGPVVGQADLGAGIIVFKFKATDIDPIADDFSDVAVTCIRIQNLGTATVEDIAEVAILDEDGNSVASAEPPVAVVDGAALEGTPCEFIEAAGTGSNNPQIQWEVYFRLDGSGDITAGIDGGPEFVIPDDGSEEFQVVVRVSHEANAPDEADLEDDSQNHTLVLRATLQMNETVGSPPVPTTFVDPVTDLAPEVIWNGGINRWTEDSWVVNPIMPGDTGVVSRFTVCDWDSNENQLIIDRFFVKQDEGGTATHSDIVSLDLYRVEGFTRTLVASRTPDLDFNRSSGGTGADGTQGMAIPAGGFTAITVPDDTCMTFELEAQVSQFAFKGHTIMPRFQISTQEPAAFPIHQTVDPEVKTSKATMIGKGLLVLPDTRLIGKPGILPLQVMGVQLPGLGTLQVGPWGKLQYDPRVISITEIEGVGPYLVTATEINNRLGEARFTVQVNPNYDVDGDGNPDNPLLTALQDGTVANFIITPTGSPGARTRLVLTFDCFELVDQPNCLPVGFPNPNVPNQSPNNDISVSAGEVVILYPGDIDMDGQPTVRDSLILANAILDCTTSAQPQADAFPTAVENVAWDTASDANVTISGNNLTKNAGGAAFNAGAVSTKKLYFGNGFVETTVDEVNTDRLFGLSKGDTNQNESDIDFAIFLKDNGQLEVRRNATQIVPNPAVTYVANDVLRVEVSGDDVLFKKNGATFLTLSNVITADSYPLLVDTSLFDVNATLENVRIQSLGGSTINTDALVGLTDEQKSVADVVAPFADIDEIPGCSELTSADVAEIARLAINFGTSPAPSAVAASVAAPADRPWYGFLSDLWAWISGENQVEQARVELGFNAATQSMDLSVSDVHAGALGGIQGRIHFDPAAMQVNGVSGLNGYTVLAYQLDNLRGELRFLALAPKGQGMRQGDIVRLHVNASAQGAAPSLTVEALVDEDALDIAFALQQARILAAAPAPLSLSGVQALSQGQGSFRFQATGSGITGIQVQAYNLAGGKVFDQETSGNTLAFNGLSLTGKPLANGVYLYVITVKGANGQSVRSQVNKLAILR